MNQIDPIRFTYTTTAINIKEKLSELQFNGFFITSLDVTTEGKIQVVAHKSFNRLSQQLYSDLDISTMNLKLAQFKLEKAK